MPRWWILIHLRVLVVQKTSDGQRPEGGKAHHRGTQRRTLGVVRYGLVGGDVLAHGFDFDGEVLVVGGVEVSDGDHAEELFVAVFGVGDGDVADFAIGHEVAGFGEGCFGGAGDDIFGHGFGDLGCCWVELCGDDAGEDVSFGDDACDVVECVGDDE